MRTNWYPMSEEERNAIDEFEEEVRFGKYLPPKIDILLIGESIPKNYSYNFYKVNTLKSPFIQIIYDVYKKKDVLGEKRFKLHGYKNFLEYFKSNNNFLYDLCEVPVDHLQNKERKLRKEICVNGESRLTDFLDDEKPKYIFLCVKSLDEIVRRSISKSKKEPIIYKVSKFPRRDNKEYQKEFEKDLSDFLLNCSQDKSY